MKPEELQSLKDRLAKAGFIQRQIDCCEQALIDLARSTRLVVFDDTSKTRKSIVGGDIGSSDQTLAIIARLQDGLSGFMSDSLSNLKADLRREMEAL